MLRITSIIILISNMLILHGQHIASFNNRSTDGITQILFIDYKNCQRSDSINFQNNGNLSNGTRTAFSNDSILAIGDEVSRIEFYKLNNGSFDLITPLYFFTDIDGLRPINALSYGDDNWIYYSREDVYRYNPTSDINEKLNLAIGNGGTQIRGITFHQDDFYYLEFFPQNNTNNLFRVNAQMTGRELIISGIPGINFGYYLSSIQCHCEETKLLAWTPSTTFYILNIDNETYVQDCSVSGTDGFENIGEGFTIGYPKWSDCKLSIDLDLDDEVYQFNRDYTQSPCGYSDIPLSDNDVQVFASGGRIDSIVIELLQAQPDEYIIGVANGRISILGDGSHHLVLIGDQQAGFDDYEDVIRSLRFIDDGPFEVDTKEITFKAYHEGQHGIIATSTLDISSQAPVAGMDSTIILCASDEQIDLDLMLEDNISDQGNWLQDVSSLRFEYPMDTLFQYVVHQNNCPSDTAEFLIQVRKEISFEFIDTSLCPGSVFELNNQFYDSSGQIIHGIENNRCDSSYLIYNLSFDSLTESFIDTLLCSGEILNIAGQSFTENTQTAITLRSQDDCDSLIYYISVEFEDERNFIDHQTFSIEANVAETITPELPENYQLLEWSPTTGLSCTDCLQPEVTLSNNQSYELEVLNPLGCLQLILIDIDVVVSDDIFGHYYLPNIINPNDHLNEAFFVHTAPDNSMDYDINIYDRWGNLVFFQTNLATNDKSFAWKGLSQDGLSLEKGVYIYQIALKKNGIKKIVIGDVLLL